MAAILTIAQLILGAFLSFLALLEQFTFDACGAPNPECNFSLGPVAFFVVPIACVIALGFTLFGILRRRTLSFTCWWVPAAAFGISLLGFGISMLLLVMATGRGL